MFFIFEIDFVSEKSYIVQLLKAYAQDRSAKVEIYRSASGVVLVFNKDDKGIESFLLGLEAILPASIYLSESRHYFSDQKPPAEESPHIDIPLNISLCPNCQKELFDISSRRYYYPFISCNSCGTQHPFVTGYPFGREKSTMKYIVPCAECKKERQYNHFRKNQHLISCIECGIPLRMNDGKSERFANDKGSYRRLFEVSAKAIEKGKTVLMKTPNGYRKFFKAQKTDESSNHILLMTSAEKMNEHLMMVTQEFNALLSIEKPLVRVSTKSDELKSAYGTSAWVKYPDDGMTMLLAKELSSLGIAYISYTECESDEEADYLVDFDIPINTQRDSRLFINQDSKFYISGSRGIYPAVVSVEKDLLSIANGMAAVPMGGAMLIDDMDNFKDIAVSRVNILREEAFESGHSDEKVFEAREASMLSVLAEHSFIGEKAVGVHFDSSLYFLYGNGKNIIDAVPPNPFEADHLFENISKLREGSDRLVKNYKKQFPEIYERLMKLSGDADIFTITAIILGIDNESLDGISAEALSFLGKGGMQIDTRVSGNRFDNYAFLASVMSYKLGGAQSNLIAYSIYESFGDYVGEIVTQLMARSEAKIVTFSGETIANQALYARILRHLGAKKILFPKRFPIGRECAVHGGIYL